MAKLTKNQKIAIWAIAVPASLGIIGGIIKHYWSNKKGSESGPTTIVTQGDSNTAYIAGRDIHTGIDSEDALKILVETSAKLGRSEKENEQLKQTVRSLEEKLARPFVETSIASEKSTPVPSAEAKKLAKLITQDDGPYALALKAIADGNTEDADELLDETQRFVDRVQQEKDEAQAKIYVARMQNASYAGRPQDALQYCDKLRPLAVNNAQILSEMAEVYYENAEYKEAELLVQRALKIDETSFGSNHPDVASRLNDLAVLYMATNRFKEAEPLMERALKINENSFGSEHLEVATTLNNLAALYMATNRFKEAEPLLKRVVKFFENPGSQPLPDYASALNNLAALYSNTNRLKEAESLYKHAIKIYEKYLGPEHPKIATALNNLAALYMATNRFKEAEPLFERALKIDEASLSPEHPDTARALNNIAYLYQDTNRLEEAELLAEHALTITEKSLGPEHPEVAMALNNLATLYLATNRLKEAEPLMKRQLVIFIKFTRQTGHPHPRLLTAIKNYHDLLSKMGYSKDEIDFRLEEMFK